MGDERFSDLDVLTMGRELNIDFEKVVDVFDKTPLEFAYIVLFSLSMLYHLTENFLCTRGIVK